MIILVILLSVGLLAASTEKATPQELIKKCEEASKLIEEKGDAALTEINNKNGQFVWKDSYVFVINTKTLRIAAHPMNSTLVGLDVKTTKDRNGNYWAIEMVKVGIGEGAGWVQYEWPKAGENEVSDKVSYVKKVPGTDYIVAAGIYDYTKEDVEKILKK